MIFILDKQENIINTLKKNVIANNGYPFFDDILTEDLATGGETFSFSTIAQGDISRDLIIGNYVAFQKEGKYKLFQIVQIEESHQEVIYINVYCESAGLELINKVFRGGELISVSLDRFLRTILNETGWDVGYIAAGGSEISLDFKIEDSSVYSILQNNIPKYGVEIEFRVEILNGRISRKYVDTYTSRGRVTGKRFSFGRDIENISRKMDSTELFTALIGKGKHGLSFKDIKLEGINKPLGQDYVEDEEAFNLYNHSGHHIMGVFYFDTDSPQVLLKETYKKLQKVKKPKVEYTLSVTMLGELLGEEWNTVCIGDTVTVVDHAFNPPIQLMARVTKLETSMTDTLANTCTLANFIEVSSNITDEMRKIAAELEGYVDNSVNSKFPIGGEDIENGAIGGSHIIRDTISTDHLQANSINADKIEANSIKTKHLQADQIKAEHISAEQIQSTHIMAGQIQTEHIETGSITAESGIIADATIGTSQIQDAAITNAKIGSLSADKITTGSLDASKINVTNLNADNIITGSINSSLINISDMTNLANLTDTRVIEESFILDDRINEISTIHKAIDLLDKDEIQFSAFVKTFDATTTLPLKAQINIKYEDGNVDTLVKDFAIASECREWQKRSVIIPIVLNKNKKAIGFQLFFLIEENPTNPNSQNWVSKQVLVKKLNNGKLIVDGTIEASKLKVGTITAESGVIGSLDANKITTGSLDASKINVTNLNADNIISGSISTGLLEIRDMTNLATLYQESASKEYLISSRDTMLSSKNILASDCRDGAEFLFELECKIVSGCTLPLNAMISLKDINGTSFSYPTTKLCDYSQANNWLKVSGSIKLPSNNEISYITPLLQIPKPSNETNVNNWLIRNVIVRRKNGGKLIVDGAITADKIQSNSISAGHLQANSINADKIVSNQILSKHIEANQILAKHIKAGEISADKIQSETINTIQLGASQITADKIQSGEIKVGNANIVDGTISGAKISNASISNAQISTAFIADAFIKKLDASKITTGSLDASKVTISGTGGQLRIVDNTLSISDKNRVRVQVGKDSRGQYGIYVLNSQGQAIFDSDRGVLIPNGLGSNVVTTDKIVDGAIGSTKLNVDELFVGNNAFINSLKAVEVSAEQITTGKINSERLDITGLVSFEAFDKDLQPIFDTSGDKTYINGGMIATNSIKAEKIDVKGLTVKNNKNDITLAVSEEGDIKINGLLQSSNFNEDTSTGYKIDPDGTAVFNQATIRGDISLPNAGITNYGAINNSNENCLKNSDFSKYTEVDYNWDVNLNGNTKPDYWNVYNSGVTNAQTGYHANLDLKTFPYPVIRFVNNDGRWKGLTYGIEEKFNFKAGVKYTISFDVYYDREGLDLVHGGIYLKKLNQEGHEFRDGMFYVNNIPSKKWVRFSKTFTRISDVDNTAYTTLYIYGHRGEHGTAYVKNVKLEIGEVATPWCPSPSDVFDYTRIWAGSNYLNRDNAPFRVTQNGNLWATEATISGRLIGNIDAGKVHIHEDMFVINSTETRVSNGQIITTKHANKNPFVKFSPTQSLINTDFILGSVEDKKIEFSNIDRNLDVNSTQVNINTTNTNKFKLGNMDGLNYEIFHSSHSSGGEHILKYHDKLGGIIFNSIGSDFGGNDSVFDFKFEKNNSTSTVNVKVVGNVEIRNAIKGEAQPIEMRNVQGEGWGWYAT